MTYAGCVVRASPQRLWETLCAGEEDIHRMFIRATRSGRARLEPLGREHAVPERGGEMLVVREVSVERRSGHRSWRWSRQALFRALPTRCSYCGGRVVRTDPMAAKSCNSCGRWAE